ncbi:MAG: cytochrome c [Bacteroidota bacterium]|nr:cytochrome c [Bacteroidota bacterium]
MVFSLKAAGAFAGLVLFFIEGFSQKLSFYADVQPLIHSKCATCHRPGGGAPFNLITYEDVSGRAKFIRKVVTSRYMPPWRADDHYVAFANDRSLNDNEIAMITDWIDAGTPKGKKRNDRERDLMEKIRQGTTYHRAPDLTLKMSYSYHLKANGGERFMVFKIPFELAEEANVEAVEFTTNNKRVIHHANFAIHPVPDPSIDIHTTIDSIDLNTSRYLYDQWLPYKKEMTYYGGWIPGASYESYPQDMGWVMPKRGVMLLTIHFPPVGKPEECISGVNFFFKKTPVARKVKVISLGSGGIGERDIFPPLLLLANEVQTHHLRIANSREDITVLYVWPHMHYLGKEFKAFATRGQDTIRLVHIPKWDFRWQEIYQYEKPVILNKGDVVHVYGTYDNTADNPMNPNNPPQLVTSSGDMRSDQEMMTMLLVYVTYEKGDESLSFKGSAGP